VNLRLLEAKRADPARELQREMVRVWSQMDRIDRDAAQRVLNAVAEMRRDVLDRLAALPTVTIDDHDSFEATALRGFAIDLQDAARRFEERYSLLLGEDMRAAASTMDEAHRAALTQLARSSGVPQSFITMSPLGLSDTQMEAAILMNNSAIRNVSQSVVTRVNAEIQAVVYGGQSRWDAVKNIRDALGTGQNLGALTNRAITIERTGVMMAFNIAADHAYRQAQEELPELQVEWVTAKDKRVDPLCVSMNGKRKEPRGTFPGGIVAPPRHPRCRCRTVAYLPAWEGK
jgi:SPP1 gp7 family putative phage head morphogenesis protein